MMLSSPHKQIPCKVTAYVDEKIKDLVELLNSFDELSSFESCQGRPDKGELAFVYMDYGDCDAPCDDRAKFMEMAGFVHEMAICLGRHTDDNDIDGVGNCTVVSIEWRGYKAFPFISIKMPTRLISEVTRLFSLFRDEYIQHMLGKQLLHSVMREHAEHLPYKQF
jgi:hypothetical protein